jgi:hypothetical protein
VEHRGHATQRLAGTGPVAIAAVVTIAVFVGAFLIAHGGGSSGPSATVRARDAAAARTAQSTAEAHAAALARRARSVGARFITSTGPLRLAAPRPTHHGKAAAAASTAPAVTTTTAAPSASSTAATSAPAVRTTAPSHHHASSGQSGSGTTVIGG